MGDILMPWPDAALAPVPQNPWWVRDGEAASSLIMLYHNQNSKLYLTLKLFNSLCTFEY